MSDTPRRLPEMSHYSMFIRELNAWEVAYLSVFAALLGYIALRLALEQWRGWRRWREEQRRMREMTNLEALTISTKARMLRAGREEQ